MVLPVELKLPVIFEGAETVQEKVVDASVTLELKETLVDVSLQIVFLVTAGIAITVGLIVTTAVLIVPIHVLDVGVIE
jgi:hypothetical protein